MPHLIHKEAVTVCLDQVYWDLEAKLAEKALSEADYNAGMHVLKLVRMRTSLIEEVKEDVR